jgi:DMSO/TMAO reductase YedYZ molybdopterin-dependent catalytic subunit
MTNMLRTLTADPQVSETTVQYLGSLITPTDAFYIRNHFDIPVVEEVNWRLRVEGETAIELSLADVKALPAREYVATLECAGNSRSFLSRPADGVQFTHGGVSTAIWRGVRLRDVLDLAAAPAGAVEVWMQGLDEGVEDGRHMAYERCLPLDKAFHDDTLLAYEMNGEPLSAAHGAPLRCIAPGWYGMASVKWLRRIAFLSQPFTGFFQHDRYRFERPNKGDYQEPLDRMRLKSLILTPGSDARLHAGKHVIEGVAWAGECAVKRVCLSLDGGATWQITELTSDAKPYTWTQWRLACDLPAGEHTLLACAVDDAGDQQRLEEDWNYRGYANSMARPVRVVAE